MEEHTLSVKGQTHTTRGEIQQALECYEQALRIAQTIKDRYGEANTSWHMGLLLAEQGDTTQAATLMQICVDYEREINHLELEKHAIELAKILHQKTDLL